VSNNQLVVTSPTMQLILGLNVLELFITEKIEQICNKKAEIALVGVFTIVDLSEWTPEWSSLGPEISLKKLVWWSLNHWNYR
jgi:hypothetical protein